jgi:ribosomal protein L14E/L6E/L27E
MWTEHNIAEVSGAFSVSVFRLKVSRWKSVVISSDYFNSVLMMEAEKFSESLENKPVPHWGNPQNIIDIVFVNFSCSAHLFISSGV